MKSAVCGRCDGGRSPVSWKSLFSLDFHEPWGKENASPHARDLRAGSPRPLTAHSALGAAGDAPYGLSRRTTSEAKLAVQPPLEWRAAEQPYPDCAE